MTDEATGVPDETLENRRQRLYEHKREVSAKISDICRFIGLGLVAVFYTVKIGSHPESVEGWRLCLLYLVGVSGVVAIILDYVQYVSNYQSVDDALKRNTLRYKRNSWAYRGGEFAFAWKQRVTFFGALALIVLVASA